MKIKLSCIECNNDPDLKKEYSFELRDDNTYSIKCDYGHESIIFYKSHKFELLFEMGIYAMLDGYYREAVSNFATSIERFHEFSIEIFIQKLFNTKNTSPWLMQNKTSEYDKAWSKISNSSERQLGAYTMLYLSVYKFAPELITTKQVEFRNKVIHKGYFPTEKETLDYAIVIFNYLQSKLLKLKENMNEELEYVYERKMREYIAKENVEGKHLVNWADIMTFRSLSPIDEVKSLVFNGILEDRKYGYKSFVNK
ncbi:hypothetical protein MHH81_20755 [Psychrobacillus sp. FSL H8-0484]|uniref:hypothetical protein n=1 Tax=Psychrobacillus sp. FSL H8-0484 TaxID=2921390 RepID=UPI0030F9B61D